MENIEEFDMSVDRKYSQLVVPHEILFMATRLQTQLENITIPEKGTEFYFDQKTMSWANRPTTDPNDYKITTLNGQTIKIPNFYQTFKESALIKDVVIRLDNYSSEALFGGIRYDDPLTPFQQILRGDCYLGEYFCNICTGEWFGRDNSCKLTTRDRIAWEDQVVSNQRLSRLEYLFDRVREKSSMIDEFLKISEQVEKEENKCTDLPKQK